MCGILGAVTVKERVDLNLDQARRALHHRGPDAAGLRTLELGGAQCVLVHSRLRIVDLSTDADQPMTGEDGTVWLVYNGELYNHRELRIDLERAGHRFRSASDTEVLVHLYEEYADNPEQMLHRLRGMFAFAVADERRGQVVVARDRLGIKPMYWAEIDGGIAFASEVRALVGSGLVPARPHEDAVAGYLAWGVVPAPATIVEGVRELLPGSLLIWSAGRVTVRRWWQLTIDPDARFSDGAERLMAATLDDAVARHLVADRPVGVFLSGGIDSRAVAEVASRYGKVHALTVTFPEEADDEGDAAAAIASRLGAQHDLVPVTGADVAGSFESILQAMDQPTSDGANSWIVCRAAHDAGLVVALSGVGGDEIFGGYPSFRLVPAAARLQRIAQVVPRGMRLRAAGAAARRAPGGKLSRTLAAAPGTGGAYRAVRGMFGAAEIGADARSNDQPLANGDVTVLEVGHYLGNQLLRDADQMSMAHSLEVRVPLLDDNIVRAATALPIAIRLRPGKATLALAAGLPPASVPKRGFTLPFQRWLDGPLRNDVREGVLSDELPFADAVPRQLRTAVWSGYEAGRVHWSRPWAIAVLRRWPVANGFSW